MIRIAISMDPNCDKIQDAHCDIDKDTPCDNDQDTHGDTNINMDAHPSIVFLLNIV